MSHKLIYNDSSHAYWLNGRRVKSVTAVAKIVSDGFALEQWRKRQVAIGMMLEPRLAERVAVDPENRELVDKVADDALQIAGAHHAANRGTQRHRASELADTGGVLLTDQQRLDAAAWQATLDRYGIEILPEFVEGFAIWPEFGVVGRFDRIGRLDGRPVIIDLKSGENAVKYPHSTAAQLALYANAPLISVGGATSGDRTVVTEWQPVPADLDLEAGYVVLLGDDAEVGSLYRIDIAHGIAGARHALGLVEWRKAYDYGAELASVVTPMVVTPVPATETEAVGNLEAAGLDVEQVHHFDPEEFTEQWNASSYGRDLAKRIELAVSVPELEQLYRDSRQIWTADHTRAAAARKASLLAPRTTRRHQALRDVTATAATD